MNEDLFAFEETDGGYILTRFNGDETVTEVITPAEHNGKAVVEIGNSAFVNSGFLRKLMISEGVRSIGADAFMGCEALRSVSLPASLEVIGSGAFGACRELCGVEFKSYPKFGGIVFVNDPKLPAEIALMGAVRSRDITRPLDIDQLRKEIGYANQISHYKPWFSRADVVALAIENDCFREINKELLDDLLKYSIEHNAPEITAYFLELKRQKFGFNGDDLEW